MLQRFSWEHATASISNKLQNTTRVYHSMVIFKSWFCIWIYFAIWLLIYHCGQIFHFNSIIANYEPFLKICHQYVRQWSLQKLKLRSEWFSCYLIYKHIDFSKQNSCIVKLKHYHHITYGPGVPEHCAGNRINVRASMSTTYNFEKKFRAVWRKWMFQFVQI